MARGSWFVQLESLEIWECDMMEQVLLWNEEENQTNIHIPLVFPKLKKLELFFLPRLTSFSKGKIFQSVEFPLLEDMTVWNCPLQSFVFNTCSTRSPDDDDSRHLFGELDKVKFGSLKVVRLEVLDEGRNSNCSPQIPIDIFNELCKLNLSGFKSLKSLFSLSMTESSRLLQLEELEIEKCDMMEQVLWWNGEENQRNNGITLQFPRLKLLKLSHMPTLTSFSKGIFQPIEFPLLEKMEVQNCPLLKGLISSASSDDHDDVSNIQFFSRVNNYLQVKFDRLTKLVVGESVEMGRNWHRFPIDLFAGLCKLRVSGFKEMKNLFSLPMTQSGCLLQLEKLQISNCEIMEQIILWNEDEENQRNIRITPFPKLKLLILDSLPRLASFCKGIKRIVEFSLPEKLKICNCPILLESCVSTSISPTGPFHDDDDSMHLFCSLNKVKFDILTKLVVGESVEMGRNWHQFSIDLFAGLCELSVSGFKEMKSLFSLPMTQSGCLLQLEKVEISDCEIMEQIILWNEDEENKMNIHITPFPKLKLLILDSLPMLTSFCKGIKRIVEFSLPEKLEIHNCPILLESCVSTAISPTGPSHDDDDSMHLFCSPNKVEFGSLKELSIRSYDNMRNWCGQISIDFFAVLCKLEVSSLKGMESLFPCSIARNLQNLVVLVIGDCEEMVKVIEDEEDDALQISLFPNLEHVGLWQLKKLKSFCEWRCTLQLPKLEDLQIFDCDEMDEFTLGALNTPNLKTIRIDGRNIGNEVNKALQQRRLKREIATQFQTNSLILAHVHDQKQLGTRLEESSAEEIQQIDSNFLFCN
ncbi:hypothetical protein C2S51_023840 [Perilla frutescens var. frutescens]|nr:hypothetical protein C2S51_023840 [Perilla frutescens var. frutescens]